MNQFLWLCPLAVVVDGVIGDPRSRWHPVVLIGVLISFLERRLLRLSDSASIKRWKGLSLVLFVLGVVYGITWGFLQVLAVYASSQWVFAIEVLVVSFTISPRALVQAGLDIRSQLQAGDVDAARRKVSHIVGRDTHSLDEAEITRATVETMAENIVDGVLSPLFFALLGGAPLAVLYRAVNTMDSMLGYRNDRFRDFGMPAARTDDVFNYIPARISGALIVVVALLLRYDWVGAAKAIWSDAAKHPSPNSGISEAGVAGALGVQLGGLNYYGGVPSQRATMGRADEQLNRTHIVKTAWIIYGVTMLFCIFSTAMSWMWKGSGAV